jgi:hypothetical protein
MSGHKRALVQLSRIDQHRIDSIKSRLRQVEQDYLEVKNSVQDIKSQNIKNFSHDIESRQKYFEDILGSYNTEIHNIESQTGQAIIEQTNNFSLQLVDKEKFLHEETNLLLRQHIHSVKSIFLHNQQNILDKFNILKDEISQVNQEKNTHRFLSEYALNVASGLLQSINEVYDHEKFFPGLLNTIAGEIDTGIINLNHGMFEAAIIQAQQASRSLTNLRSNLEELIQRTELIKAFIIEDGTRLILSIERNAFVNAIDLDGNELVYLVDIDYWSSGKLTQLKRRCIGLINQLNEDDHVLNFEEYDRIAEYILPQLEQSLADIIEEARIKVILSQIRYNIANIIIDNLSDQGFSVLEAIYQDNDERKPYAVVSQNLEGSQVRIHINSGEKPGSYNLNIDCYEPEAYNRSELHHRSNRLLSSLQSSGLKIGSVSEVNSSEPMLLREKPVNSYQANSLQMVKNYGT